MRFLAGMLLKELCKIEHVKSVAREFYVIKMAVNGKTTTQRAYERREDRTCRDITPEEFEKIPIGDQDTVINFIESGECSV